MAQQEEKRKQIDENINVLLSNSPIESVFALDTLLVYLGNLIEYPNEEKFKKIRLTNVAYQERLGQIPGGQDVLLALGFTVQDDFLMFAENLTPEYISTLRDIKKNLMSNLAERKKVMATIPRVPADRNLTSIAAVGACDNIGRRPTMEDDHIEIDAFNNVDTQGLFCIYDGHGGRGAVDFVARTLHQNLLYDMGRNPQKPVPDALTDAYLATDSQLRKEGILHSGTTAVTCFFRRMPDGVRMLYTGNVGDSRAVLCRGGQAVRLTLDHKGTDPQEAKRVVDDGGFIGRFNRVNGVLAITRAIGDHILKDVVPALPYISESALQDDDKFVILACDGLWDVMSDQEAVEFVAKHIDDALAAEGQAGATGDSKRQLEREWAKKNLKTVSQALIRKAIDLRSMDNITVMLLWL